MVIELSLSPDFTVTFGTVFSLGLYYTSPPVFDKCTFFIGGKYEKVYSEKDSLNFIKFLITPFVKLS